MKKWFTGCICFLGLTLNAKTITLEIPDELFSDVTSIFGNFDGSITVRNPRLFWNGKFTHLVYNEVSAKGICFLLSKKFVSFTPVGFTNNIETISLTPTGELYETRLTDSGIATVSCR